MSNVERRVLFDALAMVRGREPPPSVRVLSSPGDGVRASLAAHQPPAEWERDLREISPITSHTSHLRFGWLEGGKQPIRRWVLYEAVPAALVPPDLRDMLGGKPWWELPFALREGRKHLVSAYQWEVYRQHRLWVRPFWCLQGSDGGTPSRYTELEERLLKLTQQPATPPAPGSLPYACWDGRARRSVVERDRLWKMGQSVDRLRASGKSHAMKAETEVADRAFRKAFLAWWAERLAPQADFLTHYTRTGEADRTLRPATTGEANAAGEMHDHFIEYGVFPHAADSPDN